MSDDLKAMPETYWREKLSPEQYRILREKGTERAFTGKYYHEQGAGIYRCAACDQELFKSDTKYDSGSGWPSFWAAVNDQAVETHADKSWIMDRDEIVCSRCGSHLGHVFDDGPQPTGRRFCVNSASLRLESPETP